MPTNDAYRFLFVINPCAGGNDKSVWQDAIKKHFADGPHTYSFLETTGKNDKKNLSEAIRNRHPHRVIAVGGDGTLRLVAELAARHKVVSGMLPAGSANGMASELSLPTDVDEAIKVILGDELRYLDAIRINGHYSIHLSDAGLNAQLIAHFEETPGRGLWSYARQIAKTLRNRRRFEAKIYLDDRYIRHRATMILIANGRSYGTGVLVNENGSLHDGNFEVIVFRDVTFWGVVRSFFKGVASFRPRQQVYSGKNLRIKLRRPMPFQVDGEFMGRVQTIEAQILPRDVQVLVSKPIP